MSIHTKDMKDLKMYKGSNKLFIPLSPNDNKHGSLIYLLTPDISSSIDMINSNMIINRNWFKSYYIDKSINAIIKPGTGEIQEFVQYEDETVKAFINEAKLSSKERKALSDNDFGIPKSRSYPINDEEHVRQAIKMFNHCPKEDERTLAKNIIKKLKEFEITDIEVGEDNRFSKYYKTFKEASVNTSGGIPIELMTDYRFTYCRKNEVRKEMPECMKLVKDFRDYKDIAEILTLGYFLVKCYDVNGNLAGFGVGYKHPIYGHQFGVYLDDDYFDDDNEKEEITKFIIYAYRDWMFNNQIKVKVVPVYYFNRDKTLIQKLKTSIKQDGNFIDRVTALKFLGDKNKTNHIQKYPFIYIDITINQGDNSNIQVSRKGDISKDIKNEGFSFGDMACFFGDEIFTEDSIDNNLKKYMYDERIRTQK